MFQPVFGGDWDAAVLKLNPAATALVFATYLGGKHRESAQGIAVDSSGQATIAGSVVAPTFDTTGSGSPVFQYDFPVTPGFEQVGVPGGFIAKLDATGQRLIYSTGSAGLPGMLTVTAMTLDFQDKVHLAGITRRGIPGENGLISAAPLQGPFGSAVLRFDPPAPVSLRMVAGNGQTGTAGLPIAQPMVVQVADSAGQPKAGVRVIFRGRRPSSPGVTAISNTSGLASATVVLDSGPGELTVEAGFLIAQLGDLVSEAGAFDFEVDQAFERDGDAGVVGHGFGRSTRNVEFSADNKAFRLREL